MVFPRTRSSMGSSLRCQNNTKANKVRENSLIKLFLSHLCIYTHTQCVCVCVSELLELFPTVQFLAHCLKLRRNRKTWPVTGVISKVSKRVKKQTNNGGRNYLESFCTSQLAKYQSTVIMCVKKAFVAVH